MFVSTDPQRYLRLRQSQPKANCRHQGPAFGGRNRGPTVETRDVCHFGTIHFGARTCHGSSAKNPLFQGRPEKPR